jgi:hypothetical protein
MKQVILTPSAGKRLIAKALSDHAILSVAKQGTLVIVAGTTNGYVAEEVLKNLGIEGFSRKRFFRGVNLPPKQAAEKVTSEGRLADESKFPGDVVISKGVWLRGKTINDVADDLKEGDVIIKGANALDLDRRQAAVLIGHPKAGTIGAALTAVAGRRVKLIVAVGLEKRINGNLFELSEKLNAPGASGYRLLPAPGQVFTELDAIEWLTGANAELIAAGGVCGAEGCVLLAITGTREQQEQAVQLIDSVSGEPPFNEA